MRPHGEPEAEPDVLAIRTLGASRAAPRLRRGRPVAVESAAPATPLSLTRVTVIRPRPFADEAEAAEWLDSVTGDREVWMALAGEAAMLLNRALHAHRTATGDPYIADVDAARAVALRFGYGTGDDVAEGRWQAARELAESERRHLIRRDYEALRPQERVAGVLGGRERVAACEELILRARGDLDCDRAATAAVQLHAGLEALAAERPELLSGDDGEKLGAALQLTKAARLAALGGRDPDPEDLERALRVAEAVLRRRALD